MPIVSRNPFTGEEKVRFDELDRAAIDARIAWAHAAFHRHRLTSFRERAEKMRALADRLDGRSRDYGAILTEEMGKTLKAAIAEVKKCAVACRYYAENAERFLAPEQFETKAESSFVTYQPLGVVLAIMPWNFPLWQAFRFAAPAVMAGNVALLKHASNVPRSALLIQELFEEAGFRDGIFQTLLIGSDAVKHVIDDPRVVAVTLTGSEGAGKSVGENAGRNLKKVVLELGGSDPFVVMPSADVAEAAKVAVTARTINNGQSCIAAKRFIVHRDIADEFTRRFVEGMRSLKVGDPMLEETDLGPLALPQIAEDLEKQVNESVARGARLLCGGKRVEGTFFEATVLTDIPDDAPAAREETFGPVASLFVVDDIEAAITRANDTIYGLGSSVWTNDESERQRFIRDIEAGQVFINAMVASDPAVPFGGVKSSGFGRELSVHGIREFTNAKTVWVEGKRQDAAE